MADYPIPGVGNDFTTQNFTTQARQLSSESLRPAGMGNASADLSTTLRSFRDSLAFSFQTLNLTLNSLNNSVRTVGTKLGATDIHLYNQSQYLRTSPPGVWLGAMNPAYAQFAGNQSLIGMLTANVPYNVSPMEFWQNRAQEMGYRFSSAGINAIGTGTEVGAGLAGTLLGGPALARAIGFGSSRMAGLMLGGPVGMLAGTVVGAVADPMIRVAQEHNRDVAALQRMSARFSTGGFSTRQAQQAIAGIEDLAYNEIFNTNSLQPRLNMSGFRELTNMGLQGGLFHGTNPDELVKQVSAAANVVKFLTGVMGNKDVQETMQLVKQMKDMGVNLFYANNFAMGLGTDAFKYGRAMGINPNDMMNMAANMSTVAFGQYGNPAYVGMQPAMRNLAYMQELEKRGALTPAEIAAGGGVQTMATRMLSAQAAMLNSGNIGLPMLYAGATANGGFNIGQFQNAMGRGGYFGTIGAAAQNLFKDGIWSMSNIMANQTNVIDALARQDYMNDALLGVVGAGTNIMPGMNERGRTAKERMQLRAMYIQNWMRNNGADIDMGTAKAMAMRIDMPQYGDMVDTAANNAYRTGLIEEQRAYRSPGRTFERMGENFERFTSSIWRNAIQRPARSIADALTNVADFSYANNMSLQNTGLSMQDFDTYRAVGAYLRSSNTNQTSMYSANDVQAAYRASTLDIEGSPLTSGLFHDINRALNIVETPFRRRDLNALEDVIATNDRLANARIWNRIASGDRISSLQALAGSAYLFRAGTTEADVAKYFEGQSNSYAGDPRDRAANALWGLGSGALRDNYASSSLAISRNMAGIDIASSVLNDAVRNGKGFANGQFSDMTADEVLNTYLQEGSAQERIKRLTDEYNARNNGNKITTEQMTGFVAQRLAGRGTAAGEVGNRVAATYLAGSSEALENIAVGFSSDRNAGQWIGQEGVGGTNYSVSAAADFFQTAGISQEMLSDIYNSGGWKEMEALGNIIDLYNKGTDPDGAALKAAGIDAVKSKTGRRLLDQWKESGKGMRSIDSNMYGLKLTDRRFTGREFLGAGAAMFKNLSSGKIRESLNNLGLNLSEDEMGSILSREGGLYEYVTQDMDANTKQKQELRDFANRLHGMSQEELNKAYGLTIGKDGLTKSRAIDFLIGDQGNLAASQQAETVNRAFMKKKSAIDSAVANDNGEPYVRVKMVTDSAKAARGDLGKDTPFTKPTGTKDPSKVPGTTNFTPGEDNSTLSNIIARWLQ